MVAGALDALEQRNLVVREHGGLVALFSGDLYHGEEADVVADALDVEFGSVAQIGGHTECQQHTGDGGVDAAALHEVPQRQPYAHVENRGTHLAQVAYCQNGYAQQRVKQVGGVEMVGIFDGNHQYAAQVIGHGQCGQKHLEPDGYPLAEHAEHAQREGDVGGHGDGHAALRYGIGKCEAAQEEEHDYRHNHASTRAYDRQQRLLRRGELATQYFTLDFQSYAEEEDGHQEVVDKGPQGHGMSGMGEDVETAQAQLYGQCPQMFVEFARGVHIGHHQRQQGGCHQKDAAVHILAYGADKRVVVEALCHCCFVFFFVV